MGRQESPASEDDRPARPAAEYTIETSARRVRDLPAQLRPREEVERVGVRNASDASLLAIIMRSGTRGSSVVELAEQLLIDHKSLTALSACPVEELARNKRYRGLGKVKAQCLAAALEIGRRMTREAMPDRVAVRTPADVHRVLGDEARGLDREIFWVLHLDAKNGLCGDPHEVTRGLLDASLVHPREVFKEAIRISASAVVLAHNHPSGDPTPSAEDLRITKQLVESGKILDIRVVDHVILGHGGGDGQRTFVSLREEGIVKFGKG